MTDSPSSAALATKLDELFKPWNRSDAPGVIAGVARHGRVLYRRAFGLASIEHARALTPATRMRIGSTSKQFCCLGIMLLAEEGKLDIDQPVGAYLPGLGETCSKPTLRQLMHHTGGLHDPMLTNVFQSGGHYTQISAGGHLQMMPRLTECNFEPGTRFAYSNAGYQLLTQVTERVSGQPWAVFLHERVLRPVGMTATQALASDLELVPDMATLHLPLPDGKWRRGIYPSDELLGSGGMISTVDDMLAWAAHLRSPVKQVGSADTWRQMLEPLTFANGARHCYALGLMRDEHRGIATFHHAGATLGAQHQMLIAPEQELDIIVMSNRMDAACPALALKVLEAVLENDGLGPEPAALAPADYAAVHGRWYSRSSQMLIEIGARKVKPDAPEQLALSLYSQLTGVLRKSGGGLAMPNGPVSTLEIRTLPQDSTPPARLGVHVCGDLETFDRLADTPLPAASLTELCGRYRQPGLPKEAEIALRDGKLVFDLLPLHGASWWELQAYSEDVLGCVSYHSVPLFPLPNGAALVFERSGGKVTGFTFHTDRVRNVRFERVLD